jgi:hypothetical protein
MSGIYRCGVPALPYSRRPALSGKRTDIFAALGVVTKRNYARMLNLKHSLRRALGDNTKRGKKI